MVLLQTLSLPINGLALLIILMLVGGVVGWNRGVRAMISLALFGIVAYPIFVRGGDQVLNLVNPFWVNLPRLLAIFTGADPQTATPLDPLGVDLGLNLFTRIIAFIFLGIVVPLLLDKFNWTGWYSSKAGGPAAQPVGALLGALIAMLWSSAAVAFWQDYLQGGGGVPAGGVEGWLATAVSILPDTGLFSLAIIAVILVMLLVLNLPKVWSS